MTDGLRDLSYDSGDSSLDTLSTARRQREDELRKI